MLDQPNQPLTVSANPYRHPSEGWHPNQSWLQGESSLIENRVRPQHAPGRHLAKQFLFVPLTKGYARTREFRYHSNKTVFVAVLLDVGTTQIYRIENIRLRHTTFRDTTAPCLSTKLAETSLQLAAHHPQYPFLAISLSSEIEAPQ